MNIDLLQNETVNTVNDNITLISRTDGLSFGTDAFMLASYIDSKNKKCAELGSGTGIISLLLLQREKACEIYAYEIQEDFAKLTERNAQLNGMSDRIHVISDDIRNASQADTEGDVDIVFTNPPYMKKGSGLSNNTNEKNIARHEIFGDINDFCKAAKRLLKFGGKFYCVYRPDRLIDLLSSMRSSNIEPKKLTFIHPDSDSAPSLVLVMGTHGAGKELTVTRPLYIYKDKTHKEMTDDANYIYENGIFPEKRYK